MAIDIRKVEAAQTLSGLVGLRDNWAAHTAAGAMVLTRKSAQFLRIDPAAARALTLPADAVNGDFFVIANVGSGTEDITVNSSLVVITPTDLAIVYHNGTAWALFALIAGVVT